MSIKITFETIVSRTSLLLLGKEKQLYAVRGWYLAAVEALFEPRSESRSGASLLHCPDALSTASTAASFRKAGRVLP